MVCDNTFHIGPRKSDSLYELSVVCYRYPVSVEFKDLSIVHLKTVIISLSIKDAIINTLQKLSDAYAIDKDMGK